MLQNKNIVLGVSGSIAAYKAAHLVRLLVKSGAEVKVILTPSAADFITPLTLSTVSKNPVNSNYWDKSTGEWNNHVDLALWADLMLIAPASANTLSKMANGGCDNLLLATYLSAKCPVVFAPAMDLDMYRHPSIKANIAKLVEYGNILIPAESGELASGLVGEGRMAEPENILAFLNQYFNQALPLKGRKALVTAGPTYEKIDPVRFIGNHSSGKMGIAVANCLSQLGADVTLVLGPVSANNVNQNINVKSVQTASEMFEAVTSNSNEMDIVVMSAAVADYTPKLQSDIKLKKKDDELFIELSKTKDILKHLGENKPSHQVLVGFALETNNEYDHAVEKLNKKHLDFIVLNSLQDSGAGFGTDTNKITIIDKQLKPESFPLKSKTEVAADIVNKIISLLK